MRSFPPGFLWGAATSGHQTEGNNVNSDYWQREYAAGSAIPEVSGDGCDSFHRYAEDIELLAGSVLVIAPIVLLFVLLQRFFIQSVATAGVK